MCALTQTRHPHGHGLMAGVLIQDVDLVELGTSEIIGLPAKAESSCLHANDQIRFSTGSAIIQHTTLPCIYISLGKLVEANRATCTRISTVVYVYIEKGLKKPHSYHATKWSTPCHFVLPVNAPHSGCEPVSVPASSRHHSHRPRLPVGQNLLHVLAGGSGAEAGG